MSDKTFDQSETQTVLEENVSFEDFLRRYEGQSVEWHVGKVVEKVTNNANHNFIQLFLSRILSWYLETASLGEVIIAGVPMFISDDVPAREPDIMVVLNDSAAKLETTHLFGAADIAIEIVSPGSDIVDRGAKFHEYEAARVQEYWIIDPIRQSVDIYALDDNGHYQRIDSTKNMLRSYVLSQFELDSAILWQAKLPKGQEIIELVQKMVTSRKSNE